jgi:hypothetical protein
VVLNIDEFSEMEIRPKLGVSCRRLVIARFIAQHATKTLEKRNNISFEPKLILKVPTYSVCMTWEHATTKCAMSISKVTWCSHCYTLSTLHIT